MTQIIWRSMKMKKELKLVLIFFSIPPPLFLFFFIHPKSSCDDDDELFLWYGWPTKGILPYFQPGPLSEILTIVNLRHAASRVWTCAEPEFRLSWMKLYSNDNHYTTSKTIFLLSVSSTSTVTSLNSELPTFNSFHHSIVICIDDMHQRN